MKKVTRSVTAKTSWDDEELFAATWNLDPNSIQCIQNLQIDCRRVQLQNCAVTTSSYCVVHTHYAEFPALFR